MSRLVLGDEYDNAVFQRLSKAVARLGGTIKRREWALGGSQEVTTFDIELPEGKLEAIAETYIGLSLCGPGTLVARVARETQP
jgi:hypothetical protein